MLSTHIQEKKVLRQTQQTSHGQERSLGTNRLLLSLYWRYFLLPAVDRVFSFFNYDVLFRAKNEMTIFLAPTVSQQAKKKKTQNSIAARIT